MEFSFGFSPWWLLPIVLAAAVLAWWMYRPSRDLLPPRWRWALTVVRFFVLLTATALLLQPLISTLKKVVYPPVVVVLQDHSESLSVNRDSAFVRGQYPDLLKDFLDKTGKGKIEVQGYTFGQEVKTGLNADSLRFDEPGTALSSSLKEIRRLYENQNLAAVVLISDGVPTQGGNPVYAVEGMAQPVFTVLMGDTTPQQDVRIREVLFNEIGYLKEEMPVKVLVEASGYPAANVTVTLSGNGKVIGTQALSLSSSRQRGEASFSIRPETVGLQGFTVTVSRMPQEITYRNNVQTFYVNVLENRVKIALFAGGPHPDIGALRQAFEREDRYLLTEFVLRQPGSFFQDAASINLGEYDLIMLHNYPRGAEDKVWVGKISDHVRATGKPLLFWAGALTDLRTLTPMYDLMALTPATISPKGEEVQANFLPKYQDHSSYTFGPQWLTWVNAAPPLQRNMSDWQPKPSAEVFATLRIKNVPLDYPLFALQNNLNRKNMVFLGDGIWRMRADAYVDQESFEAFDGWLFNCIKWLMATDDKRKFRVDPAKRLFSGKETALFRGQVYDDSYNPVSGAEIKFDLRGPDGKSTEYYFGEVTSGQYNLEIAQLPEGSYTFEATGRKGEAEVGRDRGQFSVGKSNVEHIRLQADRGLMEQLALRTGGTLTYARDLPALAETLQKLDSAKPVSEFQKNRLGLYEIGALLILLICLLAAEWIIRKLFSLS